MLDIEHYVLPVAGLVKEAGTRTEAASIMDGIYREEPKWWPYGWTPEGHDDLYIIRDRMTKKACGVVGWQEFDEGGIRVGSYSIGILPEYRGSGFAKEAVAKIVSAKSAGVDEVRAYVKSGNDPSKALARSLHIPVREEF